MNLGISTFDLATLKNFDHLWQSIRVMGFQNGAILICLDSEVSEYWILEPKTANQVFVAPCNKCIGGLLVRIWVAVSMMNPYLARIVHKCVARITK